MNSPAYLNNSMTITDYYLILCHFDLVVDIVSCTLCDNIFDFSVKAKDGLCSGCTRCPTKRETVCSLDHIFKNLQKAILHIRAD